MAFDGLDIDMRVWFHRSRAVLWAVSGVVALLWWRESLIFVIVASVYANVVSDWTAAEAADDRRVLARLDDLERVIATSPHPEGAPSSGKRA